MKNLNSRLNLFQHVHPANSGDVGNPNRFGCHLARVALLSLSVAVLMLQPGCGQKPGAYRVVTENEVEPESAAPAEQPAATPETMAEPAPVTPSETATNKPAVPAAAPADQQPITAEIAPEAVAGSATEAAAGGAAMVAKRPETTAAPQPAAGSSVPAGLKEPLPIKLLIPHKEFVREGPHQALRVTFDDLDLLKVCNMEPVPPNVMEYLPDWLKNLNGQKIILRGWMFPSGRQEGISSFMFVRDNGICCFGRDPKVYDKLAVTMQPGKTTQYIAGRPFDVEATLVIEPEIEGPEEGLWWLYRLEGATVIDSGK